MCKVIYDPLDGSYYLIIKDSLPVKITKKQAKEITAALK